MGYLIPVLGFSLYHIVIAREQLGAAVELREHRDQLAVRVKDRTAELQLLIDTAAASTLAIDGARITSCNRTFADLVGGTVEDVVGTDAATYFVGRCTCGRNRRYATCG